VLLKIKEVKNNTPDHFLVDNTPATPVSSSKFPELKSAPNLLKRIEKRYNFSNILKIYPFNI
jgi:hypothetical protein